MNKVDWFALLSAPSRFSGWFDGNGIFVPVVPGAGFAGLIFRMFF
jgi:hypothetical protein